MERKNSVNIERRRVI